ncbi:MAG: hypothetical protein Q9196_004976, partial [Gyalolechia fulgens]
MDRSQEQRGIITYALSANRQRPLAGTARAAIFNTYRRSRAQFLYVVPPFALAYLLMNWAIENQQSQKLPPLRSTTTSHPFPPAPAHTRLHKTMAKEKPSTEPDEKRIHKGKTEKKRSETEGVHKSSADKKKKDKKDKEKKQKSKRADDEPPTGTTASAARAMDGEDARMTTTTGALDASEQENPGGLVAVRREDARKAPLIGALVPFAHPLADEKVGKKVLKGVKR